MRYLVLPHVREIYDFVVDIHSDQTHSGLPYEDGHLLVVAGVYESAGLTSEDDFLIALCHDAIDDCGEARREDVRQYLEARLSDFAYRTVLAMSAIGKTRRERNQDWMERIEAWTRAAAYKVGDRIVNMEARGKRDMYLREDAEFSRRIVSLCDNEYLVARYERAAGR